MGASLSSLGSPRAGKGAAAASKAPGTPELAPEGSGAGRRGAQASPLPLHPTGSLAVAQDGTVTWKLRAGSLLEALAQQEAGSNGDAAPAAHDPPAAACCASPAFAMPPAALPAACAGLLGQHSWHLVCDMAAEPGAAASVRLRWLGGPTPDGTAHPSVCCEFLLAARCGREGGASNGVDGAIDGADADNGASAAGQLLQPLLEERSYLQHAFNQRQPEAGMRCGVGPAAAAEQPEGLALEVTLRLEGVSLHVQAPLPSLVVHEAPLVLKASEEPCLLVVDGFLSPQECAALRALGAPHLKRSKVSAGDETPLRTSSGMFVTGALQEHPASRQLDAKVTALAELACRLEGRRPLTLGEATQIVRYDPGQYYALHLDNRAGDCARRACTIMVYLSTVPEGGATAFPRSTGFPLSRALEACRAGYRNEPAPPEAAAPPPPHPSQRGRGAREREPAGLRVPPLEGRAVVFWSRKPGGEEDKCSIHEAEKVGPGGQKWICTRWMRED